MINLTELDESTLPPAVREQIERQVSNGYMRSHLYICLENGHVHFDPELAGGAKSNEYYLEQASNEDVGPAIVREATDSDQAAMKSVEESALATLRQAYRPSAKALLAKNSTRRQGIRLVAVCRCHHRVVGSVEYSIAGNSIHFMSLFVHKSHRRRGIGLRLIDELQAIGRRHGLQKLSAYTIKETGNVAVFERMGFQVVSEDTTTLFESDRFERLTEVTIALDFFQIR